MNLNTAAEVHKAHCYQGEYRSCCKYGEENCPARGGIIGILTDQAMSLNVAVHYAHCYQGEYRWSCRYGDDDCPARPETDDAEEEFMLAVSEVIDGTGTTRGKVEAILEALKDYFLGDDD